MAEIADAGGTAVADTSDVASVEGPRPSSARPSGASGVSTSSSTTPASSAGPACRAVDAENLDRHLAVHLGGSFNTARAAWPQMVGQTYGRIVMTTSTGMFGLPDNTSYAAAKAAVVGLARSLSTAGAAHGIRVNCIAPAAFTRMAGQPTRRPPPTPTPARRRWRPELVAPMVGLLAHESCPVSGEVLVAGAGRFARMVLAVTEGYVFDGADPSIEDVAAHWSQICDTEGLSVPGDLIAWSRTFLRHMKPGS